MSGPTLAFVVNLVIDLGKGGTKGPDRSTCVFDFAIRVFPTLKVWKHLLLRDVPRHRKERLLAARLVWQLSEEAVEKVSF